MLAAFKAMPTILLVKHNKWPFFPHTCFRWSFCWMVFLLMVIQDFECLLSCSKAIPSGFGILCCQPGEGAREGWGGAPFSTSLTSFTLSSCMRTGYCPYAGGGGWEMVFLAGSHLSAVTVYCGRWGTYIGLSESFPINPKIYLDLFCDSEYKQSW